MSLGILASAAPLGPPLSAYDAAVVAHGPSVYYTLGDSDAVAGAADLSGNSRDGYYMGPPTVGVTGLVTGDDATAADFTPNQYVTYAGSWQSWMGATAFTLIAVIKADAVNSYRNVAATDGSSSDRGWNLYVKDGKLTAFNAANPGGSQEYSGATTLSTGTIYHVAMVCTGDTSSDTTKLYLDGTLDGTLSYGQVQGTTTTRVFTVGASWAGSVAPTLGFDGVIAKVALIPSALSGTDISDLSTLAHSGP